MISLRQKLENARSQQNISWDILEQDYILSWVLYGIASTKGLAEHLVFKGGTALKKCYFGNYRFSQDLDFTALENLPSKDELGELITKSCNLAVSEMQKYMPSPILTSKRYTEKLPHPENQEAFCIFAQLPWHKTPFTRIMVEITRKEKMIYPSVVRNIIHSYDEELRASIPTYSIEEIIIEKLRAILQHTIKLHERGWGRSRARDYYDLYRIFSDYPDKINLKDLQENFNKKIAIKRVEFKDYRDFFDELAIKEVKGTWNQWLKPLVPDAPEAEFVLDYLREYIPKLFSEKS
jgi:predicted nucleotidyltransferase component of viral defense system